MYDIAFLVTNRYQLHHYAPVARALGQPCSVVIELRDQDFGVDEDAVRRHLPDARISWIHQRELRRLDGRYDAIVCQTPVLPHAFLDRTLVIAQQYSLAKERYQYGTWRSLADLNLMFGEHSHSRVRGFASAVAVGNPLFDEHFSAQASLENGPRPRREGRVRALYLPTYGSLTSLDSVIDQMGPDDVEVTVKLHHMASEDERRRLPEWWKVVESDVSPVTLIEAADVIISDFSGAAFDAAYARRPLILVGDPTPSGRDFSRLSAADLDRSLLADVSVQYRHDTPFGDLVDQASAMIDDDHAYEAFVEQFYTNHGTAAPACAAAIHELLESGPRRDLAASVVRASTRDLILRNRALSEEIRHLRRANDRLRSRSGRTVASYTERSRRRAKAFVSRSPGLERRAVQVKHVLGRAVRTGGAPSTGRPPDEIRATATTPWQRRDALALDVEAGVASAGAVVRRIIVDGRPLLAVSADQRSTLAAVVRELARDHPGLTAVVRGGSLPADTIRTIDLQASDSLVLRLGGGTAPTELRIDFAVHRPTLGRTLSLDSRSPVVDWTSHLGGGSPALTQSPAVITRGFTDEIDLVYTWVDAADPVWDARRRQHSAGTAQLPSAANDERFLDRDELRYSLRSIWNHMPFVRRIHLVTDGQVPAWLDTTDSRISLIDHREIFPDPCALPTFNSHAIEACLHRIPGLAEHFIYANDDFFVGREATPDTFFTRVGLPRSRFAPSQFIYSGEPRPDAIPTDWAAFNTTRLIERDFGISFDRKHQHVPYALTKSLLSELEGRYPDEFDRTRRARFRSRTDVAVPSMLAHFYAIATGRGIEWETAPGDYIYADTGRADALRRFRDIRNGRPRFFCLNSTLHRVLDLSDQSVEVSMLLSELFPHPSPWELAPE